MAEKDIQNLNCLHDQSCLYQSREIFLHGFYNDQEEPGIDYRTATTFIKNLRFLDRKSSSNILVHQHTAGGFWGDGMAMFNAIEFTNSSVTFLLYANAMSMAGVIPQAANLRIIMPDTWFMVHGGSISLEGHADAVISGVFASQKEVSRMLEIYADRCLNGEYFQSQKSMTKIKCMNYIHRQIKDKSDWYMTAEEAVYYGFCDGILGREYETLEDIRI